MFYQQMLGFIHRIDKVIWPPYRDFSTDEGPSSKRLETISQIWHFLFMLYELNTSLLVRTKVPRSSRVCFR